jgi:hypothetical protein
VDKSVGSGGPIAVDGACLFVMVCACYIK